MKVLFVSVAYMPSKMPSDKQFIRDLIAHLPNDVEAAVWTINDWPEHVMTDHLGGRKVKVYARSRFLHRPRYELRNAGGNGWSYSPHPPHRPLQQLFELSSSLIASLASLRRIIRREQPDIIHLTDNMGPVIPMIRTIARGARITTTKMKCRVVGARPGLYGLFVRSSAGGADRVICFTKACARQLTAAGCDRSRLTTIPWGVPIPQRPARLDETTRRIRRRYNCEDQELLVVVSLQSDGQTSRVLDDLRGLMANLPLRAVITIKPDHWKDEYGKFASDRLVVERGPSDFHDVLWASDIMFSPTYQRFRTETATPPLTWIEAMSRETVLITTCGHGVDELVPDDSVGVVYQNADELKEKVSKWRDGASLERIKSAARARVEGKYSVHTIAQQYAALWGEASSSNRRHNDSFVSPN